MMVARESLYYALYYPLTIHTPFRNLVHVTLHECKFNFLPKEFGTLHHLQEITLSSNYVVNTIQSAWEWLEQDFMRNNLKSMKIMHYDLPELPLQITCLKNLTNLYMTSLRISSLPKEFGNLPLLHLDLSYNNLRGSEQFAWEWLMQAPIRNNLRELNLNHNYIKFLPKELGTLPHLMYLDLSSNHLGKYNRKAWEWLEQTEVKNKLLRLYLSDNLLTELPPQIGKLNALFTLWLAGNKLKCLPESIANLENLRLFDLSDNDLLYLPGSVSHLKAYICVDGNPFNLMIDDDSDDDSDDNSGDDLTTNLEVPSLVDCSAEIILKYGLDYANYGLPEGLIRYMDNERHCLLCNNPCFRYYEKGFINYPEYHEILHIKFYGSSSIQTASFECYVCSSDCAEMLRN
ncbi:leucine-rich repeat-containing protein 39-like [Linepithema humile]|uniref:leucine-rich repeat-containing protein 39-like n=1 Tax=Linepithema humile TaxID=83485 RepID=UPI00351F5274